MALNRSFIGQEFTGSVPYAVGIEKIREFAAAIGEDSPLCHDPTAARAAGHRQVVAPPTFAIAVAARAQQSVMFDPALGLDFARVVHRDQSFAHHRPIVAGDLIHCAVHVDGIAVLAGNDVLSLRCELTDDSGEPVTTARCTLVARAASPDAACST